MSSAHGGAGASASASAAVAHLSPIPSGKIDLGFRTVYEIYDSVNEEKNLVYRLDPPKKKDTIFCDGTTFLGRIKAREKGGIGIRIPSGKGSFGQTYKLDILWRNCTYHYDNRLVLSYGGYTVKWIYQENSEDILREIRALTAVYRLEGCARLRAAVVSKDGVFLLLDYVEGDTYNIWREKIDATIKATNNNEKKAIIIKIKDSVHDNLRKCLEEIHNIGYLHKDIKPNNIIIGPYNKVTIIDFGLSTPIGVVGPLGPLEYRHPSYDTGKEPDIELDILALEQVIAGTKFGTFFRSGGARRTKKSKKAKKSNRRRNTKVIRSRTQQHKKQ